MLWVVILLATGWVLSRQTSGNPVVIALGLPVILYSGYIFITPFL